MDYARQGPYDFFIVVVSLTNTMSLDVARRTLSALSPSDRTISPLHGVHGFTFLTLRAVLSRAIVVVTHTDQKHLASFPPVLRPP